MFPDVVLISILVGLVRGGTLREVPRIRGLVFLGGATVAQVSTPFLPQLGPYLMVASYIFLVWLAAVNWQHLAFRVLTVGVLLNGLVMVANGGRMPVVLEAARRLRYSVTSLASHDYSQHVLARPDTALGFLGDILYVPAPIPRVISVGDIFAMFGIFLLVQTILGKPLSLFGPAAQPARREG